jgi:hypothetical protein
VVGPLLVGAALERRVDGPNRSLRTSSSAEPVPEGRLVRLSHRHLRVRACVAEADGDRKLCKPELIDADSAATLSFWLDAAPSSVDDEERRASATFAHQVGLQEQVIELSPGRWRVTWEEAGVVRRLPVGEASLLVVELSTTSGRCERHRDACRLAPEPVARRVSVRDDAKSELSSRL